MTFKMFHPIDNGDLGYIRIGNMIPVTLNVITPIIIADLLDTNYKKIKSMFVFKEKG